MLNSITGGSTQPAIDEKLGIAADAVVTEEAQVMKEHKLNCLIALIV